MERRASLFFFLFPLTFGAAVGISYFGHCSFMIYLKYQAFVDAYYHQVVLNTAPKPMMIEMTPVVDSDDQVEPQQPEPT